MTAYEHIQKFCEETQCDSVKFKVRGDSVWITATRGESSAKLFAVLKDDDDWAYTMQRTKLALDAGGLNFK